MRGTKAKPRAGTRSHAKAPGDDCVFPPPIAATDLPRLVLHRNEDEVRKIAEYVEWQAKGETVEHAESRIDPRKRPAWPALLQLSLVLAAPAFLTGTAQGFGERSTAGGLLRLARRRGCHRRAGIVSRHALCRTFAPATWFVIQTQR